MELIYKDVLYSFLNEEIENDKDFALKLFETFKTYTLDIVEEGFTGQPDNVENLMNKAHRLKSSCSSFGAQQLESHLSKLEHSAMQGLEQEIEKSYQDVLSVAQATLDELDKEITNYFSRGAKSA